MLIPLVCTQCGGKLEVEKAQVVESGNFVIVATDRTLKCPHCGMKYLPGEKLNHISEPPSISIGSFSVSGDIKGPVVIGNGLVVTQAPRADSSGENQESNSANPQSKMNSERQNPSKKWWQMWKR